MIQPTEKFDVIVAGGGSAGVAAAVASAQTGARTILLERNHCLGGASTMRNVITYCGLYTLEEQPRLVVGGVASLVIAGLQQKKAITEPLRHRGVYVVFDPESVKVVLDAICEAANVTILFGATIIDAERIDGRVTSVTIADHGGIRKISGNAFVDCTGDGDLSHFAGADTRYGNDKSVNLGTLGTRFGGIPLAVNVTADDVAIAVTHWNATPRTELDAAACAISKDRSVVTRLPISGDLVCYLASEDYDPRQAESVTAAEIGGRKQAWNYLEIIKTIPGCEHAYLVSTGPEFGTRESRHIESRKKLTWTDIQDRRNFEDCVALGAWGAEWHQRKDYSSSFDYPPERGAYQIPLSCLSSRNTSNLFAAGRLADGDRLAGASIRVMGTAFATGQAAGIAAALSVNGDVAIAELKQVLCHQGAILD